MLAVDDLRPIGAVFGEPEALVPTLDKLASESVVFGNAWVQCATCGVSRSSLLTGRRPDTTQVLQNGLCPFTVDPRHKDWVSLPQYFKNHGYTTAGLGCAEFHFRRIPIPLPTYTRKGKLTCLWACAGRFFIRISAKARQSESRRRPGPCRVSRPCCICCHFLLGYFPCEFP